MWGKACNTPSSREIVEITLLSSDFVNRFIVTLYITDLVDKFIFIMIRIHEISEAEAPVKIVI